ncbi:MAG: hypothetical protein U1F43_03830 [Myxococcota bacterium]
MRSAIAVVCFASWAVLACSRDAPGVRARPGVGAGSVVGADAAGAEARAAYAARRAALEVDRVAWAKAWARADAATRRGLVARARARLEEAFRDDLMPAWAGTPWAFSGTSDTPGAGSIACGHFVATVLAHLGFDVPRLRLGRLASEHIARTFVAKGDVMRFSNASADAVVAAVAARGEGIYALGLDYHAGFLDVHGGQVDMCHASNLGSAEVVCEPAATSPAFVSGYRVAARLFEDDMVTGWLEGRSWVPFEPAVK